MTLRRFYRITTSVSFAFVVLLAIALFALTSMQRRFNGIQARSLESISAMLTLEVSLFEYNRLSNLYLLTGERSILSTRRELRDRVERNLSVAEELVDLEQEQIQISNLKSKLADYFRVRAEIETAQLPYETKVARGTVPLEEALQVVEGLNLYYRSRSMQANRDITQWDRNANLVSVLVIFLAIALSVWAVFLAQRLVVKPLAQAERGVRQFSTDPATRLRTEGPGEIRSIAQAFNGMADHLAHIRQQQYEFLAGVAHDLRNPLTALKSQVELLRLRPPSAESLPAALDLFVRQIERLNNMVQDLLDATRIEAGHFDLHPTWIDLRLLAQEAITLFSASSTKHILEYEAPAEPVMAYCDPHRIVQVLNNLVSNAIKYSPKGGSVRLELIQDRGLVTIAVSDQGIGIKPEELVTIFEPFQRSTTVRGTIPGLGLGLPISKKIIEAHGGDIRIKSKVGEGSRFEFWLPKHPDGIRPS